ncbi:conserved hypothetical protein [uncultured spirochete]|uniref:Methyltransferase type 11 domain-containing protein n=1 Tax=uncultured spirochete TaxID=156406 RepID=A0A3P3XJ96_9SPIR|nr:class I SAM-dependent methyltransferase [Rectinema subterraneum]SLM13587.1 conserved hypothetical protein [uncultured spirochete]
MHKTRSIVSAKESIQAYIYFWRDNIGTEIDVVFEESLKLRALEIQSGKTFSPNSPRISKHGSVFGFVAGRLRAHLYKTQALVCYHANNHNLDMEAGSSSPVTDPKVLFDDFANEYDSWFLTPAGRKVFAFELDLLLNSLPALSGIHLLEIGIGTGLFAIEFQKRGANVEGIEPSPKMRAIAEKRGLEVKYGLGEAIPYPDNSFDVVLAMTSIEFSKMPERFLQEMVRVTKPSGIVAVGVLNLWSLYGISRRVKGLFKKSLYDEAHFYSYRELKKFLSTYVNNVEVKSTVFLSPSPPNFILERADAIEHFGRHHLVPFGALLVGTGKKAEQRK